MSRPHRRTTVARSLATAVLAGGAFFAVAAATRAEQPAPPQAGPADVVATVGDSPILRGELDAAVRRAAAAPAPADAPAAGLGRQKWIEATALEQLVDTRLLRNEMEREGIRIDAVEVDGRIEQMRKQVESRGLDWQKFLAQNGRDDAAVREQIEFEMGLDWLIRPRLTPAVLDAGIERYKRLYDGTRLRVSHVLLRPDAARGAEVVGEMMARAEKIRREIVQGATTFADAARRHSAAPSRARGGDIGWISREGPLVDAFSKEAYALANGDVSKPFVTPFGVHIVQVTAVEPGRVGIDALRPKIASLLAGDVLRETVAGLKAKAEVTYTPGIAHFDPATPAGAGPRRVKITASPANPEVLAP